MSNVKGVPNFKFDELIKNLKMPLSVIPAEAGIQSFQMIVKALDPGFHRGDDFLRSYQICHLDFL